MTDPHLQTLSRLLWLADKGATTDQLTMITKTSEESEIYAQMMNMLDDQFSHQHGNNITINRMEFAEMLTKQTMHGIALGQN